MGIEIAEKSKETRVKQPMASILSTQISIWTQWIQQRLWIRINLQQQLHYECSIRLSQPSCALPIILCALFYQICLAIIETVYYTLYTCVSVINQILNKVVSQVICNECLKETRKAREKVKALYTHPYVWISMGYTISIESKQTFVCSICSVAYLLFLRFFQ